MWHAVLFQSNKYLNRFCRKDYNILKSLKKHVQQWALETTLPHVVYSITKHPSQTATTLQNFQQTTTKLYFRNKRNFCPLDAAPALSMTASTRSFVKITPNVVEAAKSSLHQFLILLETELVPERPRSPTYPSSYQLDYDGKSFSCWLTKVLQAKSFSGIYRPIKAPTAKWVARTRICFSSSGRARPHIQKELSMFRQVIAGLTLS